METTETILDNYFKVFKASVNLERVDKNNLYLNHDAAAKALGLKPENLIPGGLVF